MKPGADAWDRLSRQASLAVSICDGLLAEVAWMLGELRDLRRLLLAAPVFDWPPQFPTREAWLRWCEEDRRSEIAEMQECVWTQDFGVVE